MFRKLVGMLPSLTWRDVLHALVDSGAEQAQGIQIESVLQENNSTVSACIFNSWCNYLSVSQTQENSTSFVVCQSRLHVPLKENKVYSSYGIHVQVQVVHGCG